MVVYKHTETIEIYEMVVYKHTETLEYFKK